MKYRNIKIRIISFIVAVTMMFSSVTVYAEEQPESVTENIENAEPAAENNNSGSGDETGGSQDGYACEVVELTVTVEEVTPESVVDATDSASEPEESTELVAEPAENIAPSSEDSAVSYNGGEVNNGETLNNALEEISNTYNSDTNQFTSDVNYTKALSGDIRVTQSSTGRYNAEFTIIETETSTETVKQYNYVVSGFITEQAAKDYVDGIKNQRRYRSGETYFTIENSDLIDAEKRPLSEENATAETGYSYDSNHCWAGTTSNMLMLSGWNKVTGYTYNGENVSTEDTVFDLFAKSFTDNAGNPGYALEWFFNGIYQPQNVEDWAWLEETVDTDKDGYTAPMLKEYCSNDFVTSYDIYSGANLSYALKCLNSDADGDRCALGLVFGYYLCDDEGKPIYDEDDNHKRDGGHVVTIVGYSTDENGVPNTITIADSDNYNLSGTPDTPAADRRDYKNTYTTYPVEYYDGHWHLMNYYQGNEYDTILDDLVVLKYYSENTKDKVEASDAKLNLKDYYDLFIWKNFLSYNNENGEFFTVYQGDELFGNISFYNRGLKKDDLGETPLAYSFIISKDGQVVKTLNYSESGLTGENLDGCRLFDILMDADNPLEEGEYTVSYILNYDHSITEAYYNNNTSKIVNRFVVIKRVSPSGNVDYVVVPDTSSDSNINIETNNTDDEYQEMMAEFIAHINDYSAEADQTAFENDASKVFEFTLPSNTLISNVTEADLMEAEISFDYSVAGDMEAVDGSFAGNITSNIALTKNDYTITRNADGTISMVFSNEFMRKLPKGTHYFKLKIAGKIRIFKIDIK